jgi:paraquat-inducible protein A
MKTALQQGLAVCHVCLALNPVEHHHCARCNSPVHPRIPHSLQRTVALLITACILYLPANLLPIMTTETLGTATHSTIIGGVVLLWNMHSYPVALVILIASVIVPIGKMASLATLCWLVRYGQPLTQQQSTRLYRLTEFIGKWSMVDVFVVAILVALIQIGGVMAIRPGSAALAFAGVVITTMVAAESFDPRLLWDHGSPKDD